MNKLKLWLRQSTTRQKEQLAKLAKSSVPSLRLAANGYRTGGEISLTADFAGRIADASQLVDGHEKLPIINRADLCLACFDCPHAKACNKN